jgi:myo-inositol-1(or 4)-monophosphatase
MLEFAKTIAAETGRQLLEAYGRLDEGQIDFKGRRDMVTAVDRSAEAYLAAEITRRFPDDAILAEESIRRSGTSGRVWIVDPVDGTTNFVHGHPMFCVSIALAEGYEGMPDSGAGVFDAGASGFLRPANDPRLVLGVVNAPAMGEIFWGERGGGAWLNGRRVGVSATRDLARCLVATGFAYRRNELSNDNLGNFARMALRVQGIRRGGAAALDLCYVAAGRFDAFWELYLKPWDVAAGILLVREAGGQVTGIDDRCRPLEGVELLASNGQVHELVRPILEGPDETWAASEREKLSAARGR